MRLIVQKFGGTSVASENSRQMIVNKIKGAISEGLSPIVVVSAMGRKGSSYATDTLLSLLSPGFKQKNKRAVDFLISCGENISAAVLCNTLYDAGLNAMPLSGANAGIITDDNFTSANFIRMDKDLVLKTIEDGYIPVITGFQGVTEDGLITTIGRGGSDTSAVIIGEGLKVLRVEIYTDVDGIMTADPKVVQNAKIISDLSYFEVFQLADQGAKVIHPGAVEIAMRSNIPIIIKNTLSDEIGTLIHDGLSREKKLFTGIASIDDRVQIKVENDFELDIFSFMAERNISIDLINVFPEESIFTISKDDFEAFEDIMKQNDINFKYKDNLTQISIIGKGMTGIPGIMAKILRTLKTNGIEVLQTADSNATIWCLVHSESKLNAINLLHKELLENN
ncbi:MAG: aspartate kinase [Oscillospiraceae bacterium]|nr:aspartate kinase [Oscillospiraceae bacterium]